MEWVDSEARLDEVVARARAAGRMGLDTESDGFYAYHERICLLQINVAEQLFLVDPLAVGMPASFAALLRDPTVTKVMHGSEFDVLLLKRRHRVALRGLFDTMHAARLSGEEGLSLGKLVERHFGVRLDKRFQRYNWARRPLPPAPREYAGLDVRFLLQLQDLFTTSLTDAGLLAGAKAAFAKVERMVPRPKSFDPQAYRKLRGFQALDRSARGALGRLFVVREDIAQRINRAAFRVLNTEALLHVARTRPRSASALRATRGVPRDIPRSIAEELVAALRPRAPAASPQIQPPRDE